MKKWLACLFLLSLFSVSASFAEDIWIKEVWQQVNQEIDCDGLLLIIDARVLQPQDNTSVQEYKLERLSNDFMINKGKQIDWSQLGCDTFHGTWRPPTKSFPEYCYVTDDTIFPTCFIGMLCTLNVQNFDPDYIYDSNETFSYDVSQIAISGLTEDQVREYAENVASACGYQLGNILRVHRGDQPDMVHDSISAVNAKEGALHSPDLNKVEEYLFVDAIYPVYFNGLRLYSGDYMSTADLIEIPNMNMRIAVTSGHGIAFVNSVMLDPATLEATSKEQPILSEQEAINCIVKKYSNIFLPGIKQITVHQIALEYVPMTGDISASKGFSLYPAWVARITIETDSHEAITTYEAYHAVTGKPLF